MYDAGIDEKSLPGTDLIDIFAHMYVHASLFHDKRFQLIMPVPGYIFHIYILMITGYRKPGAPMGDRLAVVMVYGHFTGRYHRCMTPFRRKCYIFCTKIYKKLLFKPCKL